MSYLLGGQASELERLQLQARVWEPSARALLAKLGTPPGAGARMVDVGCGALGWLRVLAEWAPAAEIIGTDIEERMLAAASGFVADEKLGGVRVVKDDLFASKLPEHSFDLVHARFQLAPLGKPLEQLAAYRRLVKPGGWIVLEEPDSSSWRFHPHAPATRDILALIARAFAAAGGDFDAGVVLRSLLATEGIRAELDAHVIVMQPGHPYLKLPLQFAQSLAPRIEAIVGAEKLATLRESAVAELSSPQRWGTSFMLIQAWGRAPA